MAIFTRRTIQRLINENAEFLPRKQVKKHVDELNRMHLTQTLTPEWELVLINALSKVGRVEHEQSFGGTRRPDILFECSSNPTVRFVADIRTVSDRGFEDANPYELLFNELMKRVQARGLRPNSFSLNVEGNYREIHKGSYYIEPGDSNGTLLYKGGVKTKLKLPGIARFSEKIFGAEFEQFLGEIERVPHEPKIYSVKNEEENIDVTISYDPNQRFAGGGHLVYQRINHLTENSLYQALEDKAAQLIESGFDGTLGIIICDGGFSPLHSHPHFSTHTVDEVITFFLRHNPQISFVLTFVVERDSSRKPKPNKIIPRLYSNSDFKSHEAELIECFNQMLEYLPPARCDAFNALNRLKGKHPHEGGYKGMAIEEYHGNGARVRMSSRILLELLAGRLTHEEFLKRYGFIATDEFPQTSRNPFERSLNNGASITEITFHKDETGGDDDVVTITLAGPDAAISPFKYPPIWTTRINR